MEEVSKILITLENAVWIRQQADKHKNSGDPALLDEIKKRLEFEIAEINKILYR